MRGSVFLAMFLALASDPVAARDIINIYADSAFTSKDALDRGPGTLTVFVVHENAPDALAVAFKTATSDGFTGVWLSETSPFSVIGTSPAGIVVFYQNCLLLPALVLEVSYTIFGTSEDCSYLEVVAHPEYDYGGPNIWPCDFGPYVIGHGGRLTINPNESCSPVAVEPSTWGRVKALYR